MSGQSPDSSLAEARAAFGQLDAGQKGELATEAVKSSPDAAKKEVAVAAVHSASEESKADIADAAVKTLAPEEQEELAGRLLPDRGVTNRIWLIIVRTFASILIAATVALVGAIFVSMFRRVDTALVQILLTVFTTVAGILAGFISGRASTGRTSR